MSCTVVIKDKNLKPENIKKGVTILKVKGTLEGGSAEPVLQDASLSYTQNGTYTLNASSGYDGLGTVTVDVSVTGGGGVSPLAGMRFLYLNLTDYEQSTSSCVDTSVAPFEEPTFIDMFFRAPATDPEVDEERHFIFASMAEAEGEYEDTPFLGAYECAGNLFVNFGAVEGLILSDADYHFSNGVYISAEKIEDEETYWEVTVNGKPVGSVPYFSLSDMGTITVFGRKDGNGYTEFANNGTCFGYVFTSGDDGGCEIAAGCELALNDEYDEPEYSTYTSDVPYIRTHISDYVNETETVNWIPVEAGEYDEIHAFNYSNNSEPVTAVSGMNVLPLFDDGATLVVNVDTQTKAVNPSTNSQNVTADSGYTALSRVTVNPVTSAIDSNIQAGNIKSGVTILGVTGTYTGASGSPMLVTRTICWDAIEPYSIAYNEDPNWQAYIPVPPDHNSTSVTLTVFSNENYQIAPGPNSSLDYQEGGREYTYTVNQVGASDVVAVITTPTFTQTIAVSWEE